MGLEIVIPVVVVALLLPVGFTWAKRRFKDRSGTDLDEAIVAPSERLTSNALRELDSPPWRVVYEISHDRLGGIGHVLIGPAGIFALRTTMDPLPAAPKEEADARAIGEAAVARGAVDDALQRCSLTSDRLVWVHWGVNEGSDVAVDLMPGVTAVDGRSFDAWAGGRADDRLAASEVDLAWQTIVVAIGRPDPLA